jgi:hypothetical protein
MSAHENGKSPLIFAYAIYARRITRKEEEELLLAKLSPRKSCKADDNQQNGKAKQTEQTK